MPYVTQQQLVDRFGADELQQLTDRDGNAGAIVAAVLDEAIADADATVDAYLRQRYTLPLSPVPTVLTRIAADLVRYRLYDEHAPEAVTKRHDAALRFLRDVAAGLVSLGASDPAPTGTPETRAPRRVFTRDDLADY